MVFFLPFVLFGRRELVEKVRALDFETVEGGALGKVRRFFFGLRFLNNFPPVTNMTTYPHTPSPDGKASYEQQVILQNQVPPIEPGKRAAN